MDVELLSPCRFNAVGVLFTEGINVWDAQKKVSGLRWKAKFSAIFTFALKRRSGTHVSEGLLKG